MATLLMLPLFVPRLVAIKAVFSLPFLAAPLVVFLTALLVPLFAITMVITRVAGLLAATSRPGDYLHLPDGHQWVIASDNELT